MPPALSVICILIFSILITRITAAALENTGLSAKSAKFQARSAFTGCGFTTKESEKIVQHPIRRKLIFTLMLLGNAGIVTVIATLLMTFMHKDEKSLPWYLSIAIVAGGILVLWIVSSNKNIDKKLFNVINILLNRFTSLKSRDYSSLLNLADDYQVTELNVSEDDWVVGKTLFESNLRNEGITVLGIERLNGNYIGLPNNVVKVMQGDNLIVYGRESAIKRLDEREKGDIGDQDHEDAKVLHKKVVEHEMKEDEKNRKD